MADSQRKTANLFSSAWVQGGISATYGQDEVSNVSIRTNDYIAITPNVLYSMSRSIATSIVKLRLYDSGKNYVGVGNSQTVTIISGGTEANPMRANEYFCCFKIIKNTVAFMRIVDDSGNTNTKYMFVEGEFTSQTMPPHEPYGWLHSLRKLTTATEAVENPLYSDGTAITAYTLKGNTVQNGTPTPSNPVEVNGVGVRTAQLYNSADTIWILGILDDNGQNTGATTSHYTGNFTEVKANKSYTISDTLGAGSNQYRIYFYDAEKRWVSRTPPKLIAENSFTTPVNCKYIQIQVVIAVENTTDWMLNEGSTAKPYEPYGYKIPILSGGVTTNIYLGSTQTTRQIKKLVFDGTENWNERVSAFGYRFVMPITSAMQSDTTIGVRSMCTHQELTSTGNTYNALGVYTITALSELIMTLGGNTRLASWKSWLAAQYANGTPVTLYYALATPETGIVNEPLMKIGDYADTLSNATAIPTTEGANSITVDTTVQPSEFTATWTGWHNANVKEWNGSQWNE